MSLKIRNFVITAHIDHGKSTLADRLMELTKTVAARDMKNQLLDQMDLEREKGITIKLAPVRMEYKGYQLNLIDTPGHVDFAYEVSRSLAACEGAVLVVDATQGIQAQTLANVYLALAAGLRIIPVINKIDLDVAEVDKVADQLVELLGCQPGEVIKVSAKTGENVVAVLEAIIRDIPAPKGDLESPLKALIFDSHYDEFRGVIVYLRVFAGRLDKSAELVMMATGAEAIALEVGALRPKLSPTGSLGAGEIGYLVTNLKSAHQAKVGDTITLKTGRAASRLAGYQEVQPFVYAGFYPESNHDYEALKLAVDKLSLSDSALSVSLENSPLLGFGVRLGFLGLLHLDIVRERLEREYDLSLIVTNPSTDYRVELSSGPLIDIKSPAELPDMSQVKAINEPWIKGEIVLPTAYVGPVLNLITSRRGRQANISYSGSQAVLDFSAPLANLLTDFYDQLKSLTSGYGSFNYELANYRPEDLVKVDILVAGEKIDAMSAIVHRTEAEAVGRLSVAKLKELIPRQNFKVSLQAAIGGRIIAREDLSAYRKDVTAGLYGGDVSRKKKVLAKQKKGKQRLKKLGQVDIPAAAFSALIRRN